MKKRYTEEQIIGFLREADAGILVKELAAGPGFRRLVTTSAATSLVE